MNSITHALAFEGTTFDVVEERGQVWLRAAQVAQALGYAREDSVSRIYDRNKGEFSPCMSQTVNLTVSGLQREIRLFSLRGAHLIAMFARTAIAKKFRAWVLDLLDREVSAPAPNQVDLLSEALNFGRWMLVVRDGRIILLPVESQAFIATSESLPTMLRDPSFMSVRHLPKIIEAATQRLNGWVENQLGGVRT